MSFFDVHVIFLSYLIEFALERNLVGLRSWPGNTELPLGFQDTKLFISLVISEHVKILEECLWKKSSWLILEEPTEGNIFWSDSPYDFVQSPQICLIYGPCGSLWWFQWFVVVSFGFVHYSSAATCTKQCHHGSLVSSYRQCICSIISPAYLRTGLLSLKMSDVRHWCWSDFESKLWK